MFVNTVVVQTLIEDVLNLFVIAVPNTAGQIQLKSNASIQNLRISAKLITKGVTPTFVAAMLSTTILHVRLGNVQPMLLIVIKISASLIKEKTSNSAKRTIARQI